MGADASYKALDGSLTEIEKKEVCVCLCVCVLPASAHEQFIDVLKGFHWGRERRRRKKGQSRVTMQESYKNLLLKIECGLAKKR